MPVAVSLTALLRFSPGIAAQEEGGAAPPESPTGHRRFFDGPLDYWQHGRSVPAPNETEPQGGAAGPPKTSAGRTDTDWTQVVRQPDGSTALRELPRPLVEVLEDPSPDKIRAYWEWKGRRLEKILRAAEAMKEYRASLLGSPPAALAAARAPREPGAGGVDDAVRPQSPQGSAPGRPPEPVTLTYFHRRGCPPCDTQDGILAAWLRKHPEVTLEVLELGARPELWKKYAVRGTPSLVVESPASSRAQLLEGLSSERALDEALTGCLRSQTESSSRKEGERK